MLYNDPSFKLNKMKPEKSTCLLPRVLLITIRRIEEENYMVLIVDIFEPDETVVLDKPKLVRFLNNKHLMFTCSLFLLLRLAHYNCTTLDSHEKHILNYRIRCTMSSDIRSLPPNSLLTTVPYTMHSVFMETTLVMSAKPVLRSHKT
nr:hypothetical protein [Tanacetum cinerariifolium]